MARKLPPPHPIGTPRTPGSGRKKGTPNRKTVELRELMAVLVNDLDYQSRLREDFIKRRVHPSTEALVWSYAVGRPMERIEVSTNLSMDAKFAAEREQLKKLDLKQLEALAAESQALIDRTIAMAHPNGAIPNRDSSTR